MRERKGRRRRELERNKETRHGLAVVLPALGADEGSCGGRTRPGDREEVVGWIGGLVGGGCEWRGRGFGSGAGLDPEGEEWRREDGDGTAGLGFRVDLFI